MNGRQIREQQLREDIKQLQDIIKQLHQENEDLKAALRARLNDYEAVHGQQPHPPADDEPVAGTD